MKITVQLTPDAPITLMDESQLERQHGFVDNENEYTTWVEYYLPGQYARAVHRSVHVTLKKALTLQGETGQIGG